MAPSTRPSTQGQYSSQPPMGRSSRINCRQACTLGGVPANQTWATASAGALAAAGESFTCEVCGMGLNCGMPVSNDKEVDLKEAGGRTRLYLDADFGEDASVLLEEGPAHYLRNVLRAGVGDRL